MYTIDFQKPIHVHFIGIGGISMSGLAEILLNRHFTVTGSDMQSSDMTKHLEETGAKVVIGQKAENITDDIDLVVYTAAIHESNEEFAAAKNKGVPMMTRAALLGQIMANFAKSIAVAGTHGKTTTTSMLTHILLQADTDPTVSVGGMLDRIGGNIRVGHSDLFLTEACEYTNSFLEFYPLYSIILNVEEDQMDFFKDIEDIKNSFHKFASQTADDGLIIINGDMEHTDFILNGLAQKHVTFGLNPENDYTATDIAFDKEGNAVMVDVSGKNVTYRTALATGYIAVGPEIMACVTEGNVKKGDVLGVARVAGIMGVKKTSELIPMCHPLPIQKCAIDNELDQEKNRIHVLCTVKTEGKTGVEMEALTGVQVTLLTIYDMCKAIDKHMVMSEIHLIEKTGGKSGDFRFEEKND